MDRLLLFLVVGLMSLPSFGTDMFGSLIEFVNYKSALPCQKPKSLKECIATQGLLGKALDTASEVGLEISQVIEETAAAPQSPSKIYVQSKTYGTCLIETNNLEQLGALGFLCSSLGKVGNKISKVDRVLSLTYENNKHTLSDLTKERALKGTL